MSDQLQPCIYDQFWNDLRNELENENVSRGITQALTRVFIEEQNGGCSGLLQGFWYEKFETLFSQEEWEKISTVEKFVEFCNTLYDKNDENDSNWDILTRCFQTFRYSDIFTAMSCYNIGVNTYTKYIDCLPFKKIVDKKISNYKKGLAPIPTLVRSSGVPPKSKDEVDENTKRVRMIFASNVSLSSDILKVYFKGELGFTKQTA